MLWPGCRRPCSPTDPIGCRTRHDTCPFSLLACLLAGCCASGLSRVKREIVALCCVLCWSYTALSVCLFVWCASGWANECLRVPPGTQSDGYENGVTELRVFTRKSNAKADLEDYPSPFYAGRNVADADIQLKLNSAAARQFGGYTD